MEKKRKREKYYSEIKTLDLKDKRKVYLIILKMKNKEKAPYHLKEDLEELTSELGLDCGPVDHVYWGYNIQEFMSNSNYDFAVSFLHPSADISICIICKNKKAQKKLEKMIKRIEELEEGEYLNPIY